MRTYQRGLLLPIVAIVVLLLLVAVMAGYFTRKIPPGLEPVDEIDVSQAVAVIVQEAPFTEPVPASIETKETTIISSRLLARITGIAVPAGNRSRLLLPVERIARVGQLDVVWVAHEGKAERRFVRLGQTTTEGMVEVITGLQAGELVLPRPR